MRRIGTRTIGLLLAGMMFLGNVAGSAVVCHSDDGVALEWSVAGLCNPQSQTPDGPADLRQDDACGPCVDVPLAVTATHRMSDRPVQAGVLLDAAAAPVVVLPPSQESLRASVCPSPPLPSSGRSVVLLI